MTQYHPTLKTFRALCLTMVELIDTILQEGKTVEPPSKQEDTCPHDDMMNLSVMGNPGLRYCRRCGATVQPSNLKE